MRWKKITIYGIIVLVILAFISNYTPVKGFLDLKQEYRYSTRLGGLQTTERPFKGCDFVCVQLVLQEYKEQHPQATDTILYRTFRINPFIIWHWHDYFFHPRYKLPYLSPQEVELHHTHSFKNHYEKILYSSDLSSMLGCTAASTIEQAFQSRKTQK